MFNTIKDREIGPHMEFDEAKEIVFEACTVSFDVDICSFKSEKVRKAVEEALLDVNPINEGRNYVFLNGKV